MTAKPEDLQEAARDVARAASDLLAAQTFDDIEALKNRLATTLLGYARIDPVFSARRAKAREESHKADVPRPPVLPGIALAAAGALVSLGGIAAAITERRPLVVLIFVIPLALGIAAGCRAWKNTHREQRL